MADTNFSSSEDHDVPPLPLFLGNPLDYPDAIDGAKLPGHAVRVFATHVKRIAGGCKVINDLLAQENSDDPHRQPGDPHSPPVLLGRFHRGELELMLSASMDSLSRQADHLAAWAYEMHTAEGIREVHERTGAQLAQEPGQAEL